MKLYKINYLLFTRQDKIPGKSFQAIMLFGEHNPFITLSYACLRGIELTVTFNQSNSPTYQLKIEGPFFKCSNKSKRKKNNFILMMKKKNEFIQLYRRSIRISSEKIQRYYFRRDEVERKKN
jgi:hypothetical protein